MSDSSFAKDEMFLRAAIELAAQHSQRRDGGPFGAVVVREGTVLSRGWNEVTSANDPTAHAEVMAIRAACRELSDFRLAGCVLYASCEPCPMCLAAAYWARIDRLVYAATRDDAAAVGFDDSRLYVELAQSPEGRQLRFTQLLRAEAVAMMERWNTMADKVRY